MAATKTKKKSATRQVTVRLHGWPAETRMLSVVDACWMVDIEFRNPEHPSMSYSTTVFQSDTYEKALAKYEAYVKIVEG